MINIFRILINKSKIKVINFLAIQQLQFILDQ